MGDERRERGGERLLAVGGEDDLLGLRREVLAREIGGGRVARALGAGAGRDAQRGFERVDALEPRKALGDHRPLLRQ
ncbi:hypothetical protein ABIF94_005886 [Bradyrhizobium ottawaense]